MPRYLFVYRRASDLNERMTPEDRQRQMQKWET